SCARHAWREGAWRTSRPTSPSTRRSTRSPGPAVAQLSSSQTPLLYAPSQGPAAVLLSRLSRRCLHRLDAALQRLLDHWPNPVPGAPEHVVVANGSIAEVLRIQADRLPWRVRIEPQQVLYVGAGGDPVVRCV